MASLSLNQVVSRTAKWSLFLLSTFLCNQSTETIQATLDASISPFWVGHGLILGMRNLVFRILYHPRSHVTNCLSTENLRKTEFRSFNDPYLKFSVLSRVVMYSGVYENLVSNEFTWVK